MIRTLCLTLLAAIALTGVPDGLAAQQETDSPVWYVSHYKVPWARVDSLVTLEQQYAQRVREELTPEQTGILDRKVLIHDTGTEWNVVIMTKYPSWAAVREEPPVNAMETLWPDEEERERIQAAFNWVYEGTEHRDAIYREASEIPR